MPPRKREQPPSLRDRLAERTRELIVDALIAQLGETGAFEYSVFEVARRAGVSVRTVYRHFPTREAMFDAMNTRVASTLGLRMPATIAEMAALPRTLFPTFDQHQPLLRAQMQTNLGSQLRSHGRKGRVAAIVAALEHQLPQLDVRARRRAAAVISSLISADAWWRMKTDFGFDGTEAGDAVAWAVELLLASLERDNQRARKPRQGQDKES